MQKDSLIVTLAIMANEEKETFNTEVTLLVGGFLISGEVTSYQQYCDQHPISQGVSKALDKLSEILESKQASPEPGDAGAADNRPNFIHLRNAQLFSGNGQPIPGNGTFIRIQITHVQASFFGRLNIEKP